MTNINTDFDKIVHSVEDAHYFDSEKWYRDITKTPYEIITKDGFGICIEYKKLFKYKIGHSRGGVRFDKSKKSLEEYNDFVNYLNQELQKRKYLLLGIEHLQPENEYHRVFSKEDKTFRSSYDGTAIINLKESWISKFNSKKRYNLLYAHKKGVEVKIYDKSNKELIDKAKFFRLREETLSRHKEMNKNYTPPSDNLFNRIFKKWDFILAVADIKGKWLSYSLIFFNKRKTSAERVYAGANDYGLKLRTPSLVEMCLVDELCKRGFKTYDLWGINEGDDHKYSEFKKSLCDEVVKYGPYRVLKVRPLLANIYINVVKLRKKISNSNI